MRTYRHNLNDATKQNKMMHDSKVATKIQFHAQEYIEDTQRNEDVIKEHKRILE